MENIIARFFLFSTISSCVVLTAEFGRADQPIIGIDDQGLPIICATGSELPPVRKKQSRTANVDALPSGSRGWETVPGVIRNDGVDHFRLEVDVNGSVRSVTLSSFSPYLTYPGSEPLQLVDDGSGEDQVAGDGVYTAGPLSYDTSRTMPSNFNNSADSPAGLFITNVGSLTVTEDDNSTSAFVRGPQVGLLRTDIPVVTTTSLSSDVAISDHLINVKTSGRETQTALRALAGDVSLITGSIYAVLEDLIDFFFLFSTYKVERVPSSDTQNLYAGLHIKAKATYSGTGHNQFDSSAVFGSAGRLSAINLFDAYSRGIVSNTVTHELAHQWAAATDISLRLSDGTGHYDPLCSAASIVGGFLWQDNGDGSFTRDCTVGRNSLDQAASIDLYMMGLIDGSAVPDLYVSAAGGSIDCGQVIDDHDTTVTIADIQAIHGVRSPGPATAQHDFQLAFVAESNGRFLNDTEMTFYDILAESYTAPVADGDPAPVHGGTQWVSIARFFGHNTTWSSTIPRSASPSSSSLPAIYQLLFDTP